MFNPLHSSTCPKSTSAMKIATAKNTDDFRYEEKPSRATTKSTLFAVSKDEWDAKEECIVHTAICQKAPVGPKRHRTVKKSSPYVALADIKLRLSEGIRQSISLTISQYKIPLNKLFLNSVATYLLKAFWVNLEVSLGVTNTASSLSG